MTKPIMQFIGAMVAYVNSGYVASPIDMHILREVSSILSWLSEQEGREISIEECTLERAEQLLAMYDSPAIQKQLIKIISQLRQVVEEQGESVELDSIWETWDADQSE